MKYFQILFVTMLALWDFYKPVRAAEPPKEFSVQWIAIASPGFLKIHAKGGLASGAWVVKDGKGSGTFTSDLKDYDTGIALRNEHMRDKYLEISKYPKATLTVDPIAVGPDFNWTGTLTIKDVTKPIKGTGSIQGDKITALFRINIGDYPSLEVPSFKGVTMAKDVDVIVTSK